MTERERIAERWHYGRGLPPVTQAAKDIHALLQALEAVERDRDALWCRALVACLSTDDVRNVTAEFNHQRTQEGGPDVNPQGETYMQELAEGAEPQDLLEAADKEVADLTARVAVLEEAVRMFLEHGVAPEQPEDSPMCVVTRGSLDSLRNNVLGTSPSPTPGEAWRAMEEVIENLLVNRHKRHVHPGEPAYDLGFFTPVEIERARAALAAAKQVMGRSQEGGR